jgi:hypothetical protein
MPYTIQRTGTILTVLVIEPQVEDVPTGLAEIQRCLNAGGISEVHVGFDEAAWKSGWAGCHLTAFETSMGNLGITVRVLGRDGRLEPMIRVGDSLDHPSVVR